MQNEPGTNDERPQDRQVLYCAQYDPARSEEIPPAHEAKIRGGIPAAEQIPFASQINKFKSSICRFIQEVFNETFGDDPAVLRFNANSIGKFSERRWTVIKGNVSEGVTKARLAYTVHSEKTANERYMAKNGTREEERGPQYLFGPTQKRTKLHLKKTSVQLRKTRQSTVTSTIQKMIEASKFLKTIAQTIQTSTRFNLARDSLTASTLLFASKPPRPTPPVKHQQHVI